MKLRMKNLVKIWTHRIQILNFICPLQMYSSEDPMKFVTAELSSLDDKNNEVNSTVNKEESC